MAWSESRAFTSTFEDILENTTAIDLNTDSFKVALWGDATPDYTVASASTAFGAGVWASGEVFDAAEWPTGGQVLDSVTFAQLGGTALKWDAADEQSTGTSATLSNVYGVLVYDDSATTPVADQGICYLYAGGANSVVDGTMTVVFNAAGILTIDFSL